MKDGPMNSVETRGGDVIPVVILNWNGEEDTVECLRSIRRSVPAGFAPVLIDNGSTPDSVERLKRECSEIFGRIVFLRGSDIAAPGDNGGERFRGYLREDSLVFIENEENLGFAKGNNVGVRFAELVCAEWVMLLNNDTVIAPEAFQVLRKFLETYANFTAITPQIRYYGQNARIQNCGGDLTYFGRQKYRLANQEGSAAAKSDYSVITFITGCALLFKPQVMGTLTEDFFFGEEDYEFSLRMKRLGLQMACVHGAVVYHKVGATIMRSSNKLGSILLHYIYRLMNTRNYYSRGRWHTTRILAYLGLPILLGRNGIDPRKSISIVRQTEVYLRSHRDVRRTDYESFIMRDC
jgi:GT2 family glycosyltransferase